MTILGLDESFKTADFLRNIKDRDVNFLHNLNSSLQSVLSKLGIYIFDCFETLLFGNVAISAIVSSFFILTFD